MLHLIIIAFYIYSAVIFFQTYGSTGINLYTYCQELGLSVSTVSANLNQILASGILLIISALAAIFSFMSFMVSVFHKNYMSGN